MIGWAIETLIATTLLMLVVLGRRGPVRPKLRYAHQGGQNPPIIVVHGNALDAVTETYKRYLENRFRETFSLTGTPLRIEFRSSTNPYADKG